MAKIIGGTSIIACGAAGCVLTRTMKEYSLENIENTLENSEAKRDGESKEEYVRFHTSLFDIVIANSAIATGTGIALVVSGFRNIYQQWNYKSVNKV